MTNKDFIRRFIRGEQRYGANGHLGYSEDRLINYSTEICRIDRTNRRAMVNVKKYSNTTSRIQSMLRSALQSAGYQITDYVGEDAYFWNYGYQGAENVTVEDMRR